MALRPRQPAVEAIGVVKLFGTTPALARVTLAVPAGAVCGLVGGNGAGKTTLLRIVATLLRPTAGSVLVNGHDSVRDRAQVRRLIDLLPSAGGFYGELSALENLRFAARMHGLRPSSGELAAALARFGLGRAADERTSAYSSGMLRRLALARLALLRPRVALLDEPYAALDEEGRDLCDELLGELVHDGGSALVATHERERIERLAHLVHRLERGLLVDSQPESAEHDAVLAR